MGLDLHPTILTFFQDRMNDHNKVASVHDISGSEDYVFLIDRVNGLPPVRVHLSDAYSYGETDYVLKPKSIRRGDFILIAKPEGHFDDTDVSRANRDGIGIGRISELMGALNAKEIWNYRPRLERRNRRKTGG